MRVEEISSADSVIKHLHQNPTYKSMKDLYTRECCLISVISVVKCLQEEVSYKHTR